MQLTLLKGVVAAVTLSLGTVAAAAGPLMERANGGKTIRIGFANEVPWAYPGEGNAPLGFANAHAIGVLKAMGYENIEPVVTDWGGLVPGLMAHRFDVITGGMYILKERCKSVSFSDPIGAFGDAFIVAKGNPLKIQTYQDVKSKNATFVTGAGFNTVGAAKSEGVPEANIMQVPGPTEILAAVKAGRADAGGVNYFTALDLATKSADSIEVTNPALLPDSTKNWVGIGFRNDDQDFLLKFNEAQKKYLGSAEMLAAVGKYGYSEGNLPGDVSTEWVCKNR
jgi:polar amino acid transport system substrate-binding protein